MSSISSRDILQFMRNRVGRQNNLSGLQWISVFLLLFGVILTTFQIATFSRLHTTFPEGMTIASIPVGNLDRQRAAQRLLEAYNIPVDLRYNENIIQLDPSVVGADTLVGSVVGDPDKLPPIWDELKFKTNLLERVVGAKDNLVVKPLAENEVLMLNINSAATVGVIKDLKKGVATCTLKLPVCAEPGSKVTISRSLGNRWRLIGYGIIQ